MSKTTIQTLSVFIGLIVTFYVGLYCAQTNAQKSTHGRSKPIIHRGRSKSNFNNDVPIAVVEGRPIVVRHIDHAMKAAKIPWGYWGSLTYTIIVPKRYDKYAINVLITDSKKYKYWVSYKYLQNKR